MSEYWKCPNCKGILKKGLVGVFGTGTPIVGTATCSNCGAIFSQQEVYNGKYDVDISGMPFLASESARKSFATGQTLWDYCTLIFTEARRGRVLKPDSEKDVPTIVRRGSALFMPAILRLPNYPLKKQDNRYSELLEHDQWAISHNDEADKKKAQSSTLNKAGCLSFVLIPLLFMLASTSIAFLIGSLLFLLCIVLWSMASSMKLEKKIVFFPSDNNPTKRNVICPGCKERFESSEDITRCEDNAYKSMTLDLNLSLAAQKDGLKGVDIDMHGRLRERAEKIAKMSYKTPY
jgi:hypothetical protein